MKTNPIGSRPTNRVELGSWYASILEEQAWSGQSVTEFAAGAGISAWTLYEWRRRLSRAVNGREAQTARLVEVAVVQKERLTAPPTGSSALELSAGPQQGLDGTGRRRLAHRAEVSAS